MEFIEKTEQALECGISLPHNCGNPTARSGRAGDGKKIRVVLWLFTRQLTIDSNNRMSQPSHLDY